jgi:16S rRNA (uracil1498-N3)-methyltransferase
MRLHRFYVSQPLGEEVVIDDGSTIKQWVKVFRYKRGDRVILFNGNSDDYTYVLDDVTNSSCVLTRETVSPSYIPTRQSFLFIAFIKKDLFELVVEKATEFGITDIVPLITDHTEKKNLDRRRLEAIIKEATEQSGRGTLPVLHDPQTLPKACKSLVTHGIHEKHIYITRFSGKTIQELLLDTTNKPTSNDGIAFFVGPEGGWSEDEESFYENSAYISISLGETTLRAETAAIACAVLSSLL